LFDFLQAWNMVRVLPPSGSISRSTLSLARCQDDGEEPPTLLPVTPDNTIGYCGYVFNQETQDYTVRFRHYDPDIGRWIERDPAGYVADINVFAYGRNSPTIHMDPSGLEPADNKTKHKDPGLKYSYGTKECVQAIRDALSKLCPQATLLTEKENRPPWSDAVNPRTGKKYTKWENGWQRGVVDPNGPDEADCPDECKNPPGCKILQDIFGNAAFDVIIRSERERTFSGDPAARNVYEREGPNDKTGLIYWPCNGKESITAPDGTVRDAEPWEVLWHELIHAQHDVHGTRDKWGKDWEEVITIEETNELYKWYNKCTDSGKKNPLSPRDPFSHGYSKPLKGSPRPQGAPPAPVDGSNK
jgi:RHS repeat-associated protein